MPGICILKFTGFKAQDAVHHGDEHAFLGIGKNYLVYMFQHFYWVIKFLYSFTNQSAYHGHK